MIVRSVSNVFVNKMHALWELAMSLRASQSFPAPSNVGLPRRRRSHTVGDKLESGGRQHAGDTDQVRCSNSLTLDANHGPIFAFIHRVDASHHNNLFYRPYDKTT